MITNARGRSCDHALVRHNVLIPRFAGNRDPFDRDVSFQTVPQSLDAPDSDPFQTRRLFGFPLQRTNGAFWLGQRERQTRVQAALDNCVR